MAQPVLADPVLYGDFNVSVDALVAGDPEVPRLYQDAGSYSSMQPTFEALLAAYNAQHKPMQLVFFEDALEHLARIIRTLRLPLVRPCVRSGQGRGLRGSLARQRMPRALTMCATVVSASACRATACWWVWAAAASRAWRGWRRSPRAAVCLRSR
jgi:hypothetical protein